jgi:hypothetical protein
MDREEMVRILEEIIRDPDTNATAKCTAIRTLLEFPNPPAVDTDLYPDGFELRRKGRSADNN